MAGVELANDQTGALTEPLEPTDGQPLESDSEITPPEIDPASLPNRDIQSLISRVATAFEINGGLSAETGEMGADELKEERRKVEQLRSELNSLLEDNGTGN